MYSTLVEHKYSPIGSIPGDSDHRGCKPYSYIDTVPDNQCTGVDNRGIDPDYMSAPFERYMDLNVEYRYSLVVEGINQNLGAGFKPVEIDLEDNNCLGVEQAVGKWGLAEPDKLGAQANSTTT